jgi:hypothetical protein
MITVIIFGIITPFLTFSTTCLFQKIEGISGEKKVNTYIKNKVRHFYK